MPDTAIGWKILICKFCSALMKVARLSGSECQWLSESSPTDRDYTAWARGPGQPEPEAASGPQAQLLSLGVLVPVTIMTTARLAKLRSLEGEAISSFCPFVRVKSSSFLVANVSIGIAGTSIGLIK